MNRKILRDIDCMSGSGWNSESSDCIECPNCYTELEISNKRKIKCPECNKHLIIERGVQYMVRLTEADTSDNNSYETTQSEIASSKSAKADFS